MEGEGGREVEEFEAEGWEVEEKWEPLTSVIGPALSPAGRGREGGGLRVGVGRGDASQAVWVASSDARLSQSYVCVYPMGVMMGMAVRGARGIRERTRTCAQTWLLGCFYGRTPL